MMLPDVFFISIDCLRPDHVGAFNRLSRLTPNLDRVITRGSVFTRATSHAPFTTPAVASMLTGRYPFQTGVRLLLGQLCDNNAGTLADAAKRAGYITAGFPSSFILNSTTGLARGFDEYRDIEDGVMTRRGGCWQYGEPLNNALDTFLGRVGNDRVFCWLHYFDLHEYHLDTSAPPKTTYARDLREKVDAGCVASLFRILESHGRLDNAAFVITADHGECLFDHGVRGHGQHLYNSVLQVPLAIVWPGLMPAGAVRSELTRHVDVLPTLLDAWRIEADASFANLPGNSLLADRQAIDIHSYAEASPRQLFDGNAAEVRPFEGPEIQSIQTGDFKLIRLQNGDSELYDLRVDPRECADLLESPTASSTSIANALSERIDALVDSDAVGFASASSAEPKDDLVRERLRDLGYV
ncbi:MAG: sulfatase [Phycisphaerales bacterium]|nr:sulfatase [Phycisphaerales bacterium]MCB9862484.1 sulfatase [Phycisphaerales bacterium]